MSLTKTKEGMNLNMLQEIYIIDDDDSSIVIFRELFKNDPEYKFISVKTEQIDIALKNIPSLIVINEDAIDRDVIELCRKIRKDEDNTITPVIIVSSKSSREHRVRILRESVEYFIKKPVDEKYLYYTVKNLNRLLASNRTVSPLTGLPGNVQIHAELKKRILRQEPFCVLYVDLDNFKAYNDVYGFLKGDEIIEFTAETIVKMVHSDELENTFVGHIGGDDFVAIVPGTNCEKLCQNIISYFDKNVERYFTEADIEKALEYQREHPNRKLGDILYILDVCDPNKLIETIGEIVGTKGILLNASTIKVKLTDYISLDVAKKNKAVPFEVSSGKIKVCFANTVNSRVIDTVRLLLLNKGLVMESYITFESDIDKILKSLERKNILNGKKEEKKDGVKVALEKGLGHVKKQPKKTKNKQQIR